MELPKWIGEAASSGAVSTRARHWKLASRQPVEASAVDCVHDADAIGGVVTPQGFQLDQRVLNCQAHVLAAYKNLHDAGRIMTRIRSQKAPPHKLI
jgi:hypothetical protein